MYQRHGNNMESLLWAVQFIERRDNNLLANGEASRDQTDEEIQQLLFNDDQQQEQQQLQEQVEQLAVATTETTTTTPVATPAVVQTNSHNTFPNGTSFVQTSSSASATTGRQQQLCFKVVEQSATAPPLAPKSPPEQQHVISSTTSGIGGGRRTAVSPTTFEIIHQQGGSSSSNGGNHLVIDESIGSNANGGGMTGESSRRQRPQIPTVLRQGTREVHNKLEKDRRAHLKECFEHLKKQLPSTNDEKKTSNLNILHSALRYISTLKKKERDMEKARTIRSTERDNLKSKLLQLKREIAIMDPGFDFSSILSESDRVISSVPSHQAAMSQPIQVAVEGNQQQQQLQQQATTTVLMTSPAAASSSALSPSSAAVATNGNGLLSGAPTRVVAKVSQAQLAAITTSTTAQVGTLKEVSQSSRTQSSLQTTFSPVLYQGAPVPVVLQKLAIVHQPSAISKNLGDIFLQQQIGGKMYPVINTNYVVKPVVVVSRPNS